MANDLLWETSYYHNIFHYQPWKQTYESRQNYYYICCYSTKRYSQELLIINIFSSGNNNQPYWVSWLFREIQHWFRGSLFNSCNCQCVRVHLCDSVPEESIDLPTGQHISLDKRSSNWTFSITNILLTSSYMKHLYKLCAHPTGQNPPTECGSTHKNTHRQTHSPPAGFYGDSIRHSGCMS